MVKKHENLNQWTGSHGHTYTFQLGSARYLKLFGHWVMWFDVAVREVLAVAQLLQPSFH